MNAAPILALPAPAMLSVMLPFSGFYESRWSALVDSEEEQELDHWQSDDGRESLEDTVPAFAALAPYREDRDWSDLAGMIFDATSYAAAYAIIAKDYAESFAAWVAEELGRTYWTDAPWTYTDHQGELVTVAHRDWHRGTAFEYEEMVSPREYNFGTDRLFAKFSASDLATMRAELDATEEGRAYLAKSFADKFTSYDGFCSSYDNHVPSKPLEDWDHNELYALLCAWLRIRGTCANDLEWELNGDSNELGMSARDAAVDWAKLKELAQAWAEQRADELGLGDEWEAELPYRCPHTPDLFTNGGNA